MASPESRSAASETSGYPTTAYAAAKPNPAFYRPPYTTGYAIDDIPTRWAPPCVARSCGAAQHASPRSPCRRRPRPSVLLFDADAAADYPVTPPMEVEEDGCTLQNCCSALACLRTRLNGAVLLNPATGGLHGVRPALTRHDVYRDDYDDFYYDRSVWYCLGRCPSSSEYKLMRLYSKHVLYYAQCVVCEVLALGEYFVAGGGGGMWRYGTCGTARPAAACTSAAWCTTWPATAVRRFTLPETPWHRAPPSLCELDGQLCVTMAGRRPPMDVEPSP
uniref:Uncharacterized protein n=1 Tax=Oryza punctata TaxID=4537 RepID=A0A0E0LUZ5_ORYPU